MPARSDEPRFAAILLCAGGSRRWGLSGPKSLSSLDGRPVLERVARKAMEGGCEQVIAVLGSGADRIRAAKVVGIDRLVENVRWEHGRTGSIVVGLRAVPNGWGALVWPIDAPFVEAKSVRALLRTARQGSLAIWFTPTHLGRKGHPIVLSPEAVAQALLLPENLPFRSAPFRGGLAELQVPVNDPGVLDNTNTPEEWADAERAWLRRGGQ